MKITILGLGRMGQAVAMRLIGNGHELTVWNRSAGHAEQLVSAGAREARIPQEAVDGADVAISSLANDEAVRAVALGPGGVLATMGQRPYVEASTISPALSAELAARSASFVAMPILGAPQAVSDGDAAYLVGGGRGPVEALAPVLESLGGQIKRYARPEQASTGKLAVNLLLLSGIAALAEALAVGRTAGLDAEQLADLLGDSPMLAPGLENRFKAVLEGSGQVWWTPVLAAKDAGLATDAARSDGKELPLAATVRDLYQAAAERGLEEEDIAAVAQLYR